MLRLAVTYSVERAQLGLGYGWAGMEAIGPEAMRTFFVVGSTFQDPELHPQVAWRQHRLNCSLPGFRTS